MSIPLVLGIINGELFAASLIDCDRHLIAIRGVNAAFALEYLRSVRRLNRNDRKFRGLTGKAPGTRDNSVPSSLQDARAFVTSNGGRFITRQEAMNQFPGRPVYPGKIERAR